VADYPAHREADVALRDGSTVHVRPIREVDRKALLAFLEDLSPESRTLRFFSVASNLEWVADRLTAVDYADRSGLLASVGSGGRIVGHGVYLRTGPDRAEVALAIADDFQGRGLGTLLLGQLAEMAHAAGIATFEAEVLSENRRMIEVFRESGFPAELRSVPGAIIVRLPTSLTPEAVERFEQRERTAAVAAMRAFLAPGSVAVIGASRSRGNIAGEVFHNLLATGFVGPVYPVNPSANVVQSVLAYPSVKDVPGPVDLAVIVVPATHVIDVAEECGNAGVAGLVVISSGFAESGDEGQQRQRDLLAVCRRHGMRLIGPNCMGLLNMNADIRLNATFAPGVPPPGRVAFLSQSGALGLAVIDQASALGLGISSFVSVGNKADISGNDLINYWEQDPDTDVILLYLESFGNPRKFARITRRVGRTKPIVAVKSGRSSAGARATSSHTGALLAASDVTVDALFHQAGVIRTDTMAELFDVAALLANQLAPAGRRVGIVTNAGGPGILCADACEADGLEVPPLPEPVRRALAGFLPADASVANPVDMIASASAEDYRRAIELVARSGVDALVVIFIPPLVTRPEEVAAAIHEAADDLDGAPPVLSVFMTSAPVPDALRSGKRPVPVFPYPEEAARALARAVHYGDWRKRPEGQIPELTGLREEDAAGILAEALAEGERWLTPDEVTRLLSSYGIPVAESRVVSTAEEAGRAAAELGGPVALKAVAPGLLHKTEASAVRLGLSGTDNVRSAAEEMASAVDAAGHSVTGFLVQNMMPRGIEMLVGVVHDPLFGPVVACGAGGTAVELMKDVSVRITPLTDLDAVDMIRSLATFPLLEGYRGAPGGDLSALEDILLRVSAMVEAHSEIAEMDLNPVMALPDGAVIVDARIRVEIPTPAPPLSARRG